MTTDSAEQQLEQARNAALRILGRREHSEAELRNKLATRKVARDIIEQVIESCYHYGYLDDTRFVNVYIASRAAQGRGPVRLAYELRQKGVSEPLIAAGLENSTQDWYAIARDVCLKKCGARPPQDFKSRAKLFNYLIGRGFDREQVKYAMQAVPEMSAEED